MQSEKKERENKKVVMIKIINRLINKYAYSVIFLSLLFTGCITVGPDYKEVDMKKPNTWQAALDRGLTDEKIDEERLDAWWETLNDKTLVKLEKLAAKGNIDVKIALSRIREERAMRGIEKARLFPTLNVSSTFEEREDSENLRNFNAPQGFGESNNDDYEYYMAGFDSSWEIDIFGGLRRSIEAAEYEIEATQANFIDILITLMSEVALNYIEYRTYDERIRILKANIKTQLETYNLNKSRYNAGLIDELALQQSIRNLEQSRSMLPPLESAIIAVKNRLSVLLGLKPGELNEILEEEKSIPEIPESVAAGIPANMIRRRPDIRMAERRLAAQTARIGVAISDLYPKFYIFGTIGLESISSSDFWEGSSKFWSIGPTVNWSIFQGGAIRQNIKVQNERQRQALLNYENTILQALEDVENALTAYAKEQYRFDSLKKSVAAAKRTVLLAMDRYKAGLIDFYNVLDAERALLDLEDQLTSSRGEMVANLARLYKALGGGWEYAKNLENDLTARDALNLDNTTILNSDIYNK